jgi:predicted heme/steroid binding protein
LGLSPPKADEITSGRNPVFLRWTLTLLVLALVAILTPAVFASPEFSGQTGQPCSACHKNPDGGGALTLSGERYKADGFFWGEVERPQWGARLMKTILGFLHVLFGVVWFGSIVYVHLIIKPQSLIGGMPKSEKLLGRVCIIVVGLTGIGLTLLKVQTLRELWTTSFGVVWIVKVSVYVLMVAIAAVATTVIDRRLHRAGRTAADTKTDGKDGRPAHIIFEGRRYDVSNSKMWKGGVHMARHFADSDLTQAMAKAPHGPEVLERVKDLGPAESRQSAGADRVLKLFVGLTYFVLFCVFIVLMCVAWWRWGPPIVEAFPAWTGEKAAACLECHNRKTPAIVADWAASAHARNKVSCLHCHQAARSDTDRLGGHVDYFKTPAKTKTVEVSAAVSPRDCGLCHLGQVKEFALSKHANTIEIVRRIDPWLREGHLSTIEQVTGCEACHGSGLGVDTARFKSENFMGQGIGRLNPDGSKGNCGACHGRHTFAVAMARRAEACGSCHVGPEHPQTEIFKESKHGAIYAAEGRSWQWETAGSTWTAGVDYRSPTCAACHMSGSGDLPSSHDAGQRLSWELQAPLTIRPQETDWQAARKRMQTVCLQCHSAIWTASHFTRLDGVVSEYNRAYYQPLARKLDELHAAGVLDPGLRVDESLELEIDEFWRREGRRTKMGAAMMAPDYTWWHGFYELKKRFVYILSRANMKD